MGNVQGVWGLIEKSLALRILQEHLPRGSRHCVQRTYYLIQLRARAFCAVDQFDESGIGTELLDLGRVNNVSASHVPNRGEDLCGILTSLVLVDVLELDVYRRLGLHVWEAPSNG